MFIYETGREHDLCAAELIAAGSINKGQFGSLFITEADLDLNLLGGSLSKARLVLRQTVPIGAVAKFIAEALCGATIAQNSKLSYGINWYGQIDRSINTHKVAISVKKLLRANDQSARYVAPKQASQNLSTAQIKFNHLVEYKSCFVVGLKKLDGKQIEVVIGVVLQIQDIDWYSERDYGRPARDAKVGMLPPKLAQIMINLASPEPDTTIVDPFCGTGVVLAEALLMGFSAKGSDVEQKMVDATNSNLEWLSKKRGLGSSWKVMSEDARNLSKDTRDSNRPMAIVTEGYLGPVDNYPNDAQKRELNSLYHDFMSQAHRILKNHERLVICLPFWQIDGDVEKLKIIDQINALGYNDIHFLTPPERELLYSRAGARVGRQILVLERI